MKCAPVLPNLVQNPRTYLVVGLVRMIGSFLSLLLELLDHVRRLVLCLICGGIFLVILVFCFEESFLRLVLRIRGGTFLAPLFFCIKQY
jgi:hypothetical protein